MSCGKEQVIWHSDPAYAARQLTHWLKIPEPLWSKFEEMCSFIHNKVVPAEAVPREIQDYLQRTERKSGDSKRLVGLLSAEKLLVYEPLLRWYVSHGAVEKAVYSTIDHQATKVFTWFVEKLTSARRTGDVEKSKALLAEVFKLLGNSSYGKLLEAVERKTNVIYTKDAKVGDSALRSAYFKDLDEPDQAYELESRESRVVIKRPLQIGIAVYHQGNCECWNFITTSWTGILTDWILS